MKKKKAIKKDPFETSSWSLKVYKDAASVLSDIFCDDPPDYFKNNISAIATARIKGRSIKAENHKEAFRIFLRVNSMIEVAYYYRSRQSNGKGAKPTTKTRSNCGKRMRSLCRHKSKVHWKGEWAYFIQYALAQQPAEEAEVIWCLCYFATELVDMMHCLYAESTDKNIDTGAA